MTDLSGVIDTEDFPEAVAGEAMPAMEMMDGEPVEQTEPTEPEELPIEKLARWAAYPRPNIAKEIDPDELTKIGDRATRERQIDLDSRGEWERRIDAAMDVALQVAKEKSYPFPKASNVKFPIVTQAAISFAAHAYPAIVPGRDIVKGAVIGRDDGVPLMDPNTGQPLPMIGPDGQPVMGPDGQPMPELLLQPGEKRAKANRIAEHMSWQLTEEMEEWEDDTDTLLHVLPIVGCCFRKTYFDPEKSRNVSETVLPKHLIVNHGGVRKLEAKPRISHDFERYPHEIIERQRSGWWLDVDLGLPAEGGADEDAPHRFTEQHRLLDLDGDGYPEPYIVTVHLDTSKVLRIQARFELDKVRLNDKQEVVSIAPEHQFTKYGLIPNPDGGFYDIGFGWLLGPLNEAINSTINLMMDSAHLQTVGGGFIGSGMRLKGGSLRMKPGEWIKVDVEGGRVRESIVPMPNAGPSAVMFNLLGLLIEAAREVGSVRDIMLGEQPSSNMPATSVLALLEQGMKVFSAVFKRVHRALKRELKKLYRLNQLYLPEQVYFTVLDSPSAIAREDYDEEGLDIVPVSDPSVSTGMQKMVRAELLLNFRGDPLVDQMEIRRRYFEAAGFDDADKLIVKPDGPDPAMVAMANEESRKDDEIDLKAVETISKIAVNEATIIEKVANAEAAEAGSQIAEYRAIADSIQAEADGKAAGGEGAGADGGGVSPMAGPADDGQGDALPGGPAGVGAGLMAEGAGMDGGLAPTRPGLAGLPGPGL